jgi:hypothetical protein
MDAVGAPNWLACPPSTLDAASSVEGAATRGSAWTKAKASEGGAGPGDGDPGDGDSGSGSDGGGGEAARGGPGPRPAPDPWDLWLKHHPRRFEVPHAAVVLQSFWRGCVARGLVWGRGGKLDHAAAVRIQRLYRGCVARRQVKSMWDVVYDAAARKVTSAMKIARCGVGCGV